MSKPLRVLLLVGALGLVALIVTFLVGSTLLRQRLARARMDYAPPIVDITYPENGITAPAGSYLALTGRVFFSQSARAQLAEWSLDGTVLASQPLDPPEGLTVTYSGYNLLVPAEGGHIVSLRAINSRGIVGQSAPLFINAVAKGEAFYSIPVEEGDTLETIGKEFGADPAMLENLNPGVSAGAPVPGTNVTVPVPPKEGEEQAPEPVPAPPVAEPGPPLAVLPDNPMLGPPQFTPNLAGIGAGSLPKTPGAFKAEVQGCGVKLTWYDNADNETGYEVWQSAPGGPLVRLTTLQPASGGETSYELPAPGPGPYTYAVVAINAVGGQPSSFALVTFDEQCAAPASTDLQVEIKDVHLTVPAEKVYCYISLESAPQIRFPANDGEFVDIQVGHGDLAPWPHLFAVPIPADGALDMAGECWGWAGNDLAKLGDFSASFPAADWDGTDQLMHGNGFVISLGVEPLGAPGPGNMNYFTGPVIPAPYGVKDTVVSDPLNPTLSPDSHDRHVTWKWDGDTTKLDAFVVFLNGQVMPRSWSPTPLGLSDDFRLDRGCGQHLKWQVAARYGMVLSPLSAPYDLDLLPCQYLVKVRFLDLSLSCTGEGSTNCSSGGHYCDTLDAHYDLSVNNETRVFWGDGNNIPLPCGRREFADLGSYYQQNQIYPSADTFIVPWEDPGSPMELLLRANVWDDDGVWSDDDLIFGKSEYIMYKDFQQAITWLGEDTAGGGCTWMNVDELEQWNPSARAKLDYSIEVFPNACRDAP
jgi:hypothetical protein